MKQRIYWKLADRFVNSALKDKVPETVQKAVEDAKAKIIAGELKVPQTYLT